MSIATDITTPSDPPPPRSLAATPGRHGPGRPARVWTDRLRPARANPGVWHQLPGDYSVSVAGALRAGRYAGTKPGELEARRRVQPTGRYLVWVRVVGDVSEPVRSDDIDWGAVNHEGVPLHYVDETEDRHDGGMRYWGPLASDNGSHLGEGWHDTAADYLAALSRLREAGKLPY